MNTIEIKGVNKHFKDNHVLRDITVSFEGGKIYGLVGRNGTGKTVLMKLICGLAGPTEGEIWVEGRDIAADSSIPGSIGAIIEVPGFLPDISGFSNLKYLARLRNRIGNREIAEAMTALGLDPRNKKRVGKYSLGMRQRLGIAQAIMENPNILLLDEPMNGLDSRGVEDVKRLLLELREQGKTIILASHHMEDINELCDCAFRIENGRLSPYKDNVG